MIVVSLVFVVSINTRQNGTLERDDLPELLSAGFERYTAEIRTPVVRSPPDTGAIDRWVEASSKWGAPHVRLDPDVSEDCEDCDMHLEVRSLAIVDAEGRVLASNPGGPSTGTELVNAVHEVGRATFEAARATLKGHARRDETGDSFVVVPFLTVDGELRGLAYAKVATAPLSLAGAALRFFRLLPREIVPVLTFALILGTVFSVIISRGLLRRLRARRFPGGDGGGAGPECRREGDDRGRLTLMPERTPSSSDSSDASEGPDWGPELERPGYVIVPHAIAPETIETLRSELAPYLRGERMGRNEFEGLRSERVYRLLAKAPAVAELIEHDAVLAVADALLAPSYLLSAALVVNLHPEETCQGWNQDDALGAPPPPRPVQGVSTIWALDRFTAENGATEVVPGSHRWDKPAPGADEMQATSVCLEMEPGSVAIFPGTLYHRGGANRSEAMRLGMTIQYCQPWLRQLENMMLGVPPELAARYSRRIQELVGYQLVAGTFVGYVDGQHPRKLIDRLE